MDGLHLPYLLFFVGPGLASSFVSGLHQWRRAGRLLGPESERRPPCHGGGVAEQIESVLKRADVSRVFGKTTRTSGAQLRSGARPGS